MEQKTIVVMLIVLAVGIGAYYAGGQNQKIMELEQEIDLLRQGNEAIALEPFGFSSYQGIVQDVSEKSLTLALEDGRKLAFLIVTNQTRIARSVPLEEEAIPGHQTGFRRMAEK
jgi:hypothetical protein